MSKPETAGKDAGERPARAQETLNADHRERRPGTGGSDKDRGQAQNAHRLPIADLGAPCQSQLAQLARSINIEENHGGRGVETCIDAAHRGRNESGDQ